MLGDSSLKEIRAYISLNVLKYIHNLLEDFTILGITCIILNKIMTPPHPILATGECLES